MIKQFEDLLVWQKSKTVTIKIYTLLKDNKDYSYKDQIYRASTSIMNNIAEGFERQTNKEYVNFLFIAKGSSSEVRSMISLGKDLKYIYENDFNDLYKEIIEISKMLSGLIKSIKQSGLIGRNNY